MPAGYEIPILIVTVMTLMILLYHCYNNNFYTGSLKSKIKSAMKDIPKKYISGDNSGVSLDDPNKFSVYENTDIDGWIVENGVAENIDQVKTACQNWNANGVQGEQRCTAFGFWPEKKRYYLLSAFKPTTLCTSIGNSPGYTTGVRDLNGTNYNWS